MIEQIVKDYLEMKLDVPVCFEMPGKIESFVLIEKTGSSTEDFINSATIAIQSYAASLHGAMMLNEKVKGAMSGIIALNTISGVKLNTDYNFTDTTKEKYRYQAVFDLFY